MVTHSASCGTRVWKGCDVIDPDPAGDSAQADREALRRALDQSLPDVTSDELGDALTETKSEAEYRRERPPHHGG